VRSIAAVALFPLLVAAMTAFAVFGSTLDLATPLGVAASVNPSLLLLLAIAIFYPVVALLERLSPHRAEWNEGHGDVPADALYLLVSSPLAQALFEATLRGAAVAGAAALTSRFGFSPWPASWPPLAQLFLAIAVAEFGHYWFHRISHENAWVWRLHATHHSAPRLYWLNATRFHPLDLFALLAFQTLPLILAGATPRAILMYSLFAAVYGQLQHANVRLRTGPLDWLFATPGLHRFHHSTDPREGNANYGAILIGWDLVFRSFFRPRGRDFDGPVGIAAMPHFPRGWLAQLASPFRWSEIAMRARDESTRSHTS
jgi:sterol desaturase/sphingolipid hydroxylase (fatty acid hydroxylase superfamily)